MSGSQAAPRGVSAPPLVASTEGSVALATSSCIWSFTRTEYLPTGRRGGGSIQGRGHLQGDPLPWPPPPVSAASLGQSTCLQ